jgi:DNA-binding IclR family transcriptional regulator
MTTIDKALDTLFFLSEQRSPQRLSEIAGALDMPRSSAHRVLAPLVKRNLVEQDSKGRYHVGLGMLALGVGAVEREPLALAARPVLEAAAEEFGETFFLVVPRGGKLVVIEKAEGNGFMRAAPRLGSSVPAHATAVGKLVLAFDAEAAGAAELSRFTPATIVSQQALRAELAQVREQAWAVNDEEWHAGLAVAAAPVFVHQRLAGCVALAMLAVRFHELGEAAIVRRVSHAAEGIALRLEGGRR